MTPVNPKNAFGNKEQISKANLAELVKQWI